MATEKILTKIMLATDTLANWAASSRVLKKGEVALATTDNGVQVRVGTGADNSTWANSKILDLSGLTTYIGDKTVAAKIQEVVDSLTGYTTVDDFNGLTSIVNTISSDYLKAADKTELTASIAGVAATLNTVSSDYLKAADKTELSTAIDAKSTVYIDAVKSDLGIYKVTPSEYAEALQKGIPTSALYIVETDDGHIDALGQRVQNVGTPTDDTDAATKAYVDTAVAGVTSNALSGVTNDSVTGVVTSITEADNKVLVTHTSLAGTTDALTGNHNAIISITQDANGKISSVTGTHLLSAVTVEKIAAPATGYSAQYQVKVDGTACATTIDIPVDKVLSSGKLVEIKKVSDTEYTVDGTTVTDTAEVDAIKAVYTEDGKHYIQLGLENVTTHIYIAVPELVDAYTGKDGTTVAVTVSDYEIGAEVKNGSLTMTKFSATDTFIFDCGDASIA